MSNIPGFSKIFGLGDRTTADLFNDYVEITEKVDGSQFSFGTVDGEVVMRSKNCSVHLNDGNKMFTKAAQYAHALHDAGLLSDYPGYVFHAEYLNSPRHNSLEYDRVPKNHFALYAVRRPDGSLIEDYDKVAAIAGILNIDVAPLLYRGKLSDAPGYLPEKHYEWLNQLIDKTSFLGKAKMEGCVIKRYGDVLIAGVMQPALCGKHVSDQFKETHKIAWKADNPTNIEKLAAALKTDARWHKGVQRMRDDGVLTGTLKDIGPLIGVVSRDVVDEEKEWIKEELWRLFKGDVMRIATSGIPDWYKAQLQQATE